MSASYAKRLKRTQILTGDDETLMTDSSTCDQTFLVRDCYPVYYDYIMNLLKSGHQQITVTGTPGIGKSVFYLYFERRFRHENPQTSVVSVGVSRNERIKGAVVNQPNEETSTIMGEVPRIDGALYLYDGPPPGVAVRERFICFTPPCSRWFDLMDHMELHEYLYMPLWTFEELRSALLILNRDISDEVLVERFRVFGGIARYCLTVNPSVYSEGLRELSLVFNSIESYSDVRDILIGTPENEGAACVIFQCVPHVTEDAPFAATFSRIIGSELIEQSLEHALINKTGASSLNRWLSLCCSAPSILEWLHR